MPAVRPLLLSLLGALAILAARPDTGHAAASPWSEATGAKLRLIAPGGPPAADGTLTLGIEIALEPGWKTYWRHPGEAGLPRHIELGLKASGRQDESAPPEAFEQAYLEFRAGVTALGGHITEERHDRR